MTKKPKRLAITPKLRRFYSMWLGGKHFAWLCDDTLRGYFKMPSAKAAIWLEAFDGELAETVAIEVQKGWQDDRAGVIWRWRLPRREWHLLCHSVRVVLNKLFPNSRKIEHLWIRLLYEECP